MKTPTEKDEVLGTKEAAKLLKCSRQTLVVMVNRGVIPSGKIGNRYKFSKQALMEYCKTKTPQGPGR